MALELVNKLPYDHPYRWDGTLFGGPKLWRPDELGASLALWLDAEDTSTITLNGSTVAQWNDKSGNNRHMSQATASAQPTYNATGLNGKPILAFNADFIQAQTGWLNYTDGLQVISVFRNRSDATSILYANRVTGGSIQTRLQTVIFPQTNTFQHRIFGMTETWIGRTSPLPPLNEWAILGTLYNGGTNSSDIEISLNTQRVDTGDNVQGSFVKQTSTSSTPFTIGAQADGTFPVTGDYAESIVIQATLSTTDRQKLEGYLAWKWGLEANLPANHPYKNTPPTV